MVMGLESRRDYNYQAAVVLDEEATAEGRLAVRLLHRRRREAGPRTQLSVRRRHLRLLDMPGSSEGARRRRGALAETCAADRAAVLTRVVWERQLELRVAAPFLRRALRMKMAVGSARTSPRSSSRAPPSRSRRGLRTAASCRTGAA